MEKKHFEQKLAELETVYNQYKPHWQDLADHFLPRQARFLVRNVNKAPTVSAKIVDSTPALALRNFSSGMMSGATNPARKWFKLGVQDYGQELSYAVKNWSSDVSKLFRTIFHASNLYQNLPLVYKQLGVFGISGLSLEKDFDSVISTKVLPIGSYRNAKNNKGKVDTLYRVYTETARNLYEKFGEENCSQTVCDAIKNDHSETSFEIVHAVELNQDYIKDSAWAKNKKYISVYYERNGETKFLSKSGFDYFPYIVFETEVNGEDVYPSDGPGITSLPDVKQLYSMVKEYGKAVKKMVTPSTQGPASLKNKKMSDNPGTFNPIMDNSGNGLKPIHEVNPRVLELKNNIDELKATIEKIFYNDLFAMILHTAQRQRTATEVDELKEEKMILLSPLLEQIHTGLKDLIEWTFYTCLELEIIPPPPPEIEGATMKIEFVSTLAQAMKASNISSMERFTTFTSNLAATIDPSATMKINVNKIIDDYADFANIDPDQIVPTEIVEQQKAELAQQQAQQQALANVQQGSEIVKNMGGVDSSGGNLMERIGLQ